MINDQPESVYALELQISTILHPSFVATRPMRRLPIIRPWPELDEDAFVAVVVTREGTGR